MDTDLPSATDPTTSRAAPVDLDALYAPPSEMIQKAVLDHLVDFHLEYLNAATFFCLATGSEHGLDASPRGGPAGFVHALDAHTVAFADWPGNNRIESLRNLQQDGRLGMLFIFPGLEIFMRINGRGEVSTDPALLARLAEGERLPKTATVVRIDQVLLHCGKAVNRAKLWRADSQLGPAALPSVGKIIAALGKRDHPQAPMDEAQIEQINQHYDHSVRHDLY
nr:MSMEG_1061 family FMN-dependent PPOX-type flavoprotein [uncultured Duganella sp.]